MIDTVPPAVIFLLGAMLTPFFRGKWRSAFMLLIPVAGFLNLVYISEGNHWSVHFMDYTLVFCRMDRLSFVFGTIFHLISFIAILYSLHVKDRIQHAAGLVYAGSALGVVYAGDFFSFFVFWEMLTISSIFLIWARRTKSCPWCRISIPSGSCRGGPVPFGRYRHSGEPYGIGGV